MTTPKHMPKDDTHAIRYLIDGNCAYWLVISDDASPIGCIRRCANRCATFKGWTPGEKQVHGWASSPLYGGEPNAKYLRAYFLRELRNIIEADSYGPAPKMSVVRVDDIADLKAIEAVFAAKDAAIHADVEVAMEKAYA